MPLDTRILNLASAEEFVSRTRNVRWDGWTIVSFVPLSRANMMPSGVFNRDTGQWGIEYRVSPDHKGNYTVMAQRNRKGKK